jgi:CRISPR-associated protein (TIGR02710 family)
MGAAMSEGNETEVLLVTVGGAAEPILTLMQGRSWHHVVFICTPGSAVFSSEPVVTDPEKGIVAKSGLAPGSWSLCPVPPDDLDKVFDLVRGTIRRLRADHPGSQVRLDYTGGTKSMCAGAVLAATLEGSVALNLVTGERRDTEKVRDGTEVAAVVTTTRALVELGLVSAREAFRIGGYAEARVQLARLQGQAYRAGAIELAGGLRRQGQICDALDTWDRFEHAAALGKLRTHEARLPAHHAALVAIEASPKSEPRAIRLVDLWRNAERCARRHRYDDAVARIYRLTEWTAQWLLKRDFGIDTSNVPIERLPAGVDVGTPGRGGRIQIGLVKAWDVYCAMRGPGEAAAVWPPLLSLEPSARPLVRNLLDMRNHSILAHGHRPVDARDYERFASWCRETLMPFIAAEAMRLGESAEVPPFPQELPD